MKTLGTSFLLTVVILFKYGNCNGQSLESVPRKTCIEIFTGTWCGPCHFAEQNFKNNILPNIDNYTIIEYHQGPDFFATWEGYKRSEYYSLSYVPAFIYDGYVDSLSYIPSLSKLLSSYEKTSHLRIEILNVYHDESEQVYVTGMLLPTRSFSGNFNLRVIVTERMNNQHGNYMDTTYYNVENKMSPSEGGTPLGSLTEGVPIYFNQIIPINVSKIVSMDNLRVVVLVQNDDSKQIEQSEWQDVITSNGLIFPYYGEPSMSLLPNPASEIVTIQNVKSFNNIQLFDAAGKNYKLPFLVDSNSITINITSLTDGIYYVSVDSRKIFKLIKID